MLNCYIKHYEAGQILRLGGMKIFVSSYILQPKITSYTVKLITPLTKLMFIFYNWWKIPDKWKCLEEGFQHVF